MKRLGLNDGGTEQKSVEEENKGTGEPGTWSWSCPGVLRGGVPLKR